MRLRDKVALVTGGASGIGAAIAERFRAEGATVIAADIQATDGPQTLHLDVATPQSCIAAIAMIIARHGRLDLMVNSARIAPGGDMHQGSQEFLAWAKSYETAGLEQRSRARHHAWLAALPCPVLRLDGTAPPEALPQQVLAAPRLCPGPTKGRRL